MIREGLYPLPPNLDIDDKKTLIQWTSTLPDQAFVIIAISHGIAAFASGLIASLVVGRSRMSTGIITMSAVFLLVMVYLFTYNFPTWFVITDTIATAILGFAGAVTGSGRVYD